MFTFINITGTNYGLNRFVDVHVKLTKNTARNVMVIVEEPQYLVSEYCMLYDVVDVNEVISIYKKWFLLKNLDDAVYIQIKFTDEIGTPYVQILQGKLNALYLDPPRQTKDLSKEYYSEHINTTTTFQP